MGIPGEHLLAFTSLVGTGLLAWRVWQLVCALGKASEELNADNSWGYLSTISAAMLLLRWPFILSLAEIDVDESQMLAQAMRFLHHPVPWLHVDGTTSGPLNSYAISLLLLLGAPASWATTRSLHLLIQCATIALLYFSIRLVSNWVCARWLTLPLVLFFAYGFENAFVHYASEGVSILLISAAVYAASPICARTSVSAGRCFVAGLALGAVPLAKLQAAPMAVFLWLLLAAAIFALGSASPEDRRSLSRRLFALSAGAVVVPAIILGSVASHGAGNDFVISYLKAGLEYARDEHAGRLEAARGMLAASGSFVVFLLVVAFASFPLVAFVLRRARSGAANVVVPVAASILWVLVCLFAVLAPAKPFPHYLSLLATGLTIGLVFLSGISGSEWLASPFPTQLRTVPRLRAVVIGGLLLTLGVLACPHYGRSLSLQEAGSRREFTAAPLISMVVEPGDEISVWGWMPSLYIDTRCAPATRDAICHFVLQRGKYQRYYWHRHLEDLKRSRPPVFVDAAVAGAKLWPGWAPDSRHESFPELDAFIDEHYVLWKSLRSEVGGEPLRIYLSRERINSRQIDLRASASSR